MKRLLPLLLLAGLAGAALADSVRLTDGNLFLVAEDGSSRPLATGGDAREAVLSPDGKWIAYVRDPDAGKEPAEGDDRSELWIVDAEGKSPRLLVAPKKNTEEPKENLAAFNNLAFTQDSRALYFLSEAWVTSNALHRVELESGRVRYLADANSVQLVTQGKYAGHLIVQKHKYLKQGGSYEPYWLISPEGKEVRKIGETEESVEEFLR